jgi:NAD(P)-dependent dehydrogenase (short-subunit alcohol dehydrogenase family)
MIGLRPRSSLPQIGAFVPGPCVRSRRSLLDTVLAIVSDMKGNVLTRFITPFGFHSTAAEVISGVNLASRRVIVTGGASGIGIETARALAGAGASVTLAVRRPDAAEPVAIELRRSTGNHAIDIRTLDLSDLRSVKSFTDAWEGPLHILVNNAGIMAVPELEKTPQGVELQFGANFLGHFALTIGLQRALAKANGARVVSLSSSAHFSRQSSSTTLTSISFRTRRLGLMVSLSPAMHSWLWASHAAGQTKALPPTL